MARFGVSEFPISPRFWLVEAAVADRPLVCVVDDEEAVRRITAQVLEHHGFQVRSYAAAEPFFAEFDDNAIDCVVTDLRMPHVDGAQLQQRLQDRGSIVSLVVLSGHADVRTAVKLMENGAVTLLEKPYQPKELADAVEKAVAQTKSRRSEEHDLRTAKAGFASLTEEERAVCDLMVAGLPNKTIAMRLDISMRTVDRRRSTVLSKMSVDSVSELSSVITRLKAAGGA